jgi:hypothetical protein
MSHHVTKVGAKDHDEAKERIQYALTEACWQIGLEADQNPSVELHFDGTAEYYMYMVDLREGQEREHGNRRPWLDAHFE